MILVVEGPSGVGKTTWLAQWDRTAIVAEHGRIDPPRLSGVDQAQFWADLNSARWGQALDVERRCESALCDTDPLKLHYDYCRARSGSISWAVFESGVHAFRKAIARRRLGIADRILCEIPDATTLDARKRGDPSRTRRNFDLHEHPGARAPARCARSPSSPGSLALARSAVDQLVFGFRLLPLGSTASSDPHCTTGTAPSKPSNPVGSTGPSPHNCQRERIGIATTSTCSTAG